MTDGPPVGRENAPQKARIAIYTHTHKSKPPRYGDIVPSSTLSRVVVLACVFFFLATIPYQIGTRCRDDATCMCTTLCIPLQTHRRRGSLCYPTHTHLPPTPQHQTPPKKRQAHGGAFDALSLLLPLHVLPPGPRHGAHFDPRSGDVHGAGQVRKGRQGFCGHLMTATAAVVAVVVVRSCLCLYLPIYLLNYLSIARCPQHMYTHTTLNNNT